MSLREEAEWLYGAPCDGGNRPVGADADGRTAPLTCGAPWKALLHKSTPATQSVTKEKANFGDLRGVDLFVTLL
jgi:hypothetical protein